MEKNIFKKEIILARIKRLRRKKQGDLLLSGRGLARELEINEHTVILWRDAGLITGTAISGNQRGHVYKFSKVLNDLEAVIKQQIEANGK